MKTLIAVVFCFLFTTQAYAQARIVAANKVLAEGGSVIGSNSRIVKLEPPFMTPTGTIGFVGKLADGDHFVWSGTGATFLSSSVTGFALGYDRAGIGVLDSGVFAYSPREGATDLIWTNHGELIRETGAAPFYPGSAITILYPPILAANGDIGFVAGVDTDGLVGAERRVLYRVTGGHLANVAILLETGDVPFNSNAPLDERGVDGDYDISNTGYIAVVHLATQKDWGVVVDGVLVAQEGNPALGANWSTFDIVKINDAGNYAFSGDTDGSPARDDFIAFNGSIIIREGDNLDGIFLGGFVSGIELGEGAEMAFTWTAGGLDTLFYSPDASDAQNNSVMILQEGNGIDIDSDGLSNALVNRFNQNASFPQGIGLSNTQVAIEIEADVDANGFGETQMVITMALPRCGDGVVEGLEICDENGVDSATCNANCSLPICGDSMINLAAGEECDDAGANSATCDSDCTRPVCGDGILNSAAGEVCDSGLFPTGGCNTDCTFPSCGDGVVNAALGETCDDGMATANCDSDCSAVECGDGVLNTAAGETCEFGGADIAGCSDTCTRAVCGDGNVDVGEACDSSGESENCDVDCSEVLCGDGLLNKMAGEACEDGNANDGDGCSATCAFETSTGRNSGTNNAGTNNRTNVGAGTSNNQTNGPNNAHGLAGADDGGCATTSSKKHPIFALVFGLLLVGWRRRR